MTAPSRLYLPPSGGTPGITPARHLEWEAAPSFTRVVPSLTPTSTAFANVASLDATATANRDVCAVQFVYPLVTGTVFATTQTIKGRMLAFEGASASNLRSQCVVRVIASDSTTVRATLFAGDVTTGTTNPGSEWPLSTATNRHITTVSRSGAAVAVAANYTSVAGDHLVIEIGYRKHAAASTTGTIRFGDNAGSDLPENETQTTDGNTWIEFSGDLNPITEFNVTVPLATATAGALVVSPVIAVGALAATAVGASLAPTPQANAAAPLATAYAAALAASLALAAPLGTAFAAASVPTLALLVALGTGSGQGFDAVLVTGGPGETFAVDLATAIAAGLLPGIRAAADAPLGSASGSALAPSIGLSAPLGGASGNGSVPSLGMTVPLGIASSVGFVPTPRVAVAVTLATALASGLIPSLRLTAPLGQAFGAGIAPSRLALFMPLGTASALSLVPTIPGLSDAIFDVPRATALAASLAPIPIVRVDVPSDAALAAGITPETAITIPAPMAGATASGLLPLFVLLIPRATATGVGYVPTIIGLTPEQFGSLIASLGVTYVLDAKVTRRHALSAIVAALHTLDAEMEVL